MLTLGLCTLDLMRLGEGKAEDMGLHARPWLLSSGVGVKLSCFPSQRVLA